MKRIICLLLFLLFLVSSAISNDKDLEGDVLCMLSQEDIEIIQNLKLLENLDTLQSIQDEDIDLLENFDVIENLDEYEEEIPEQGDKHEETNKD
ncbi:MAG: hypothetical protein ISS45_02440 [Candidatus Omnitrophica bacterium]|nr:hypothetical protein [Candidatus Omnitrophota bacterium]